MAALIREETRDNAEQVEFFLKMSRSSPPRTAAEVEEALCRGFEWYPWAAVIHAHEWLADRGSGKPVSMVELTGKDGDAISVVITRTVTP